MLCSAVAFGLVACGNQPQDSVHPAARERLISGVQQVRVAVSRQDRPAAETALTTLIRDIASAQARGDLDPASARTILRAADRVSEDVRTMEGPPAAPPVVVRVPVRVPEPRPPRGHSGIPGGERAGVSPPAAEPAQRAAGEGQEHARDVRTPGSGNSGRAGQNGQSQNDQGESGQGQNDQGQDD